jgi:hypothetical protein
MDLVPHISNSSGLLVLHLLARETLNASCHLDAKCRDTGIGPIHLPNACANVPRNVEFINLSMVGHAP